MARELDADGFKLGRRRISGAAWSRGEGGWSCDTN
jgi:hypothetical protein